MAFTLFLCSALLRRQFGVRGITWAGIEVAWSILSLTALGLGFLQLNDKLDEMKIGVVHSELMTRWVDYQRDTVRLLETLTDTDQVNRVANKRSLTFPPIDEMSFERRLAKFSKMPTLAAFANISDLSTPLCGSLFGTKWAIDVKSLYDRLPPDNDTTADELLYQELLKHCIEGTKISDLAHTETALQSARTGRSGVYEFGWLWAYVLGFGLALKLLKSISDVIGEFKSKSLLGKKMG